MRQLFADLVWWHMREEIAAAAAAAENAALTGLCVEKENALTLISSTGEGLEMEKLQRQPSSPDATCAEMAIGCEDKTERDSLGFRRKRVEEVRTAPQTACVGL